MDDMRVSARARTSSIHRLKGNYLTRPNEESDDHGLGDSLYG
jgi:hypothetical protein